MFYTCGRLSYLIFSDFPARLMTIRLPFHFLSRFCLILLLFSLPFEANAHARKSPAKKIKVHQPAPAAEAEFTNFGQWRAVAEFIDLMSERHGFDREALQMQFGRANFSESVVRLINPPPPSKAKNWTLYRQRFVEPTRINAGVAFWNEYASALAQAETRYGVPAEIIVGILGVETLYGKMTGKIRVMDALTTLAFAYPPTANREERMRFFRGELEETLLFARDSDIDPFSLSGSFAGAIGWPQFMPGSVRRYAVDFDFDGKIDLLNSPVDAIGSVANFLSKHGWQSGLPLVFPANVSTDEQSRWRAMLGRSLEAQNSLEEFNAAGVSLDPSQSGSTPAELRFGLVDLQNGEQATQYWLGTANFFAIAKYNRSFFYAMSVIDLGQAVRQQRTR